MSDSVYKPGQYVIYMNGNRVEIGRVKRVTDNGAFVFYSEGDTAAKTPFDRMWPIINDYVIQTTSLGGECDMAVQERLKAREPVKWIMISPAGIYECSGCGQHVMTGDIGAYKYCHGCGRAVVWP